MTSNQFYAGLNRRFAKRERLLIGLGFARRQLAVGVAGYTRVRRGREQNTTAAHLLHADNRSWFDHLSVLLIR